MAHITKKELEETLGERIKHPCPICDGAKWTAPGDMFAIVPTMDNADDARFDISTNDDGGATFPGMEAVPMVCDNCGFIALFHTGILSGRGPTNV